MCARYFCDTAERISADVTATASGGDGTAAALSGGLAEDVTLRGYLDELTATFANNTYQLDGCRVVQRAEEWEMSPVVEQSGVWWPGRSWRQKNGVSWAQRLVAVFALEPTDALRLIRSSHLAELPPTAAALHPSSELWEQISLGRGDLLVCSAGVLSFLATTRLALKLVVCEFVGPFARPTQPYMPPLP